MKVHFLKIEPQYFEAVLDGSKKAELRLNDRGFEVGDGVVLSEHSGEATGRIIKVQITHIVELKYFIPEAKEWVMFSFEVIE